MFRLLCLSLALAVISVFCPGQSSPSQSAANASPTGQLSTNPLPQPATVVAPSPELANPLGEARILYHKGDFDGAIAKYQEFLKDHPKSPDAFAGEVRTYLKQKKVKEAAELAEQGIAQSNSPHMRVAQAEVWYRQGRINDAEKQWVEVLRSGSPEARAYLGLARVRSALAMYASEAQMIAKAHELDPLDPDIQEEWMGTLPRSERIKYLENSLAGDNNWDSDERDGVKSYLEYLKERAKQKKSSCHLVSKVTATETPLVRLMIDPQHLRGFGLSVVLNGRKNSLMLDTGASGILVKRSIAEHAGISKISETKVWGIGNKGKRNAYVGIADSIQIGALEFKNCPIEVVEGRSLAGEDGLIGADVFDDFLVDIDFPDEKLKLSELPKRPGETGQKLALNTEEDEDSTADESSSADNVQSTDGKSDAKSDAKSTKPPSPSSRLRDRYIAPEMQSYSRVYRFGHDLLIPTSIGKVPLKLFIMDTGSMTNFISPAAAREVTKVSGDYDTTVTGLSGKVDKVFSANKAILQFGRIRQENQDLTAFDTTSISDSVGTEVSGFLGFVLLRFLDIKIDYRDALVDFQYDPKRWGR